jgi:hypothetical protein
MSHNRIPESLGIRCLNESIMSLDNRVWPQIANN